MIRTVLQALRKSPSAQALPEAAPAMPAMPAGPAWAPAAPPPSTDGQAEYWPGIFEAKDLANAMEIALTPEKGMSPEQRWELETDFLIDHIGTRLNIGADHQVIDFGCGAGRMSRALIERFGCSVVGIDISQGMREQAVKYVDSPRFRVVSPEAFDELVAQGWRAEFGLACWSLQHAMYPAAQVGRIANALGAEAPFLLVNSLLRLIPTNLGWRSDGEDLDARMAERFAELERLNFPPEVAAEDVINSSRITWWQRRV